MGTAQTIKILKAFLRFPCESDRAIAKVCACSQPTVTRHRRILEQYGLLRTFAMPDLSNVGFEILACNIIKNKDSDGLDETDIRNDKTVILALRNSNETLILSVHKNVTDHIRFAAKHRIIPSSALFFPTSDKTLKPLTFSDLPIHSIEIKECHANTYFSTLRHR